MQNWYELMLRCVISQWDAINCQNCLPDMAQLRKTLVPQLRNFCNSFAGKQTRLCASSFLRFQLATFAGHKFCYSANQIVFDVSLATRLCLGARLILLLRSRRHRGVWLIPCFLVAVRSVPFDTFAVGLDGRAWRAIWGRGLHFVVQRRKTQWGDGDVDFVHPRLLPVCS